MDFRLRTYSSLIEAESARAYLEAHGIPADLPDRHAVTLQPHLLELLGGIRLTIREMDSERAEALLSEIERKSHLSAVSTEETNPLERSESEKKRNQVRWLARFIILVFGLFYAYLALKKYFV